MQLLLARDDAALAIKHYERAWALHQNDGAFDDVHINSLAELYMIQGRFRDVIAVITKTTRARGVGDGDVPMDLVAKLGVAQIYLGQLDAAQVGEDTTHACSVRRCG